MARVGIGNTFERRAAQQSRTRRPAMQWQWPEYAIGGKKSSWLFACLEIARSVVRLAGLAGRRIELREWPGN